MASPPGYRRSLKKRQGAATIGICSHLEQKRSNDQLQQAQKRRAYSNKGSKGQLNDLPMELLFDILCRLPSTHLLQSAKHTCKLWNAIISEPQFSEIHFSQSLRNPGYIYTLSDDPNMYFMDYENTTSRLQLPIQLGLHDNSKFVSCRGLLCFQSIKKNSMHVCNLPITRQHAKLPIPTPHGVILIFASGYAQLSKRYKYLHFSCKLRNAKRHIEGLIITLREESSRKLRVPPGIKQSCLTVYCNGSVHFSVEEKSGSACLNCVLSLDMETEKFRTRRVLHSGTGHEHRWPKIYITVLGDNVAFVVCSKKGFQQVWVLVDEADGTWIEKYRFNTPTPGLRNLGKFELRGLWFNRDIYGMQKTSKMNAAGWVISTEIRYFSYNVDGGKYDVLRLPFASDEDEGQSSPSDVVPHVGSLLSPSKLIAGGSEYPFLTMA